MADFDWNQFPNFSASEFRCQHTGTDGMDEDFVRCLQQLRTIYGKGMVISSGYRSAEHPIEARKPNGPGAHESGKAADIAIYGADALELLTLALQSGLFTGIGVAQKGSLGSRFLHLDTNYLVLLSLFRCFELRCAELRRGASSSSALRRFSISISNSSVPHFSFIASRKKSALPFIHATLSIILSSRRRNVWLIKPVDNKRVSITFPDS